MNVKNNSSEKSLRIGIIGTGSWASVHAETIRRIDKFAIKAFFTRKSNPFHRKNFPFFSCKVYRSIREMINKEKINLCVVANKTKYHFKDALAVINENCNVLIEKPLEIKKQSVLQLIKTQAKKKKFVGLSLQHRFDPCINLIKYMAEKKELGKILFVCIQCCYSRNKQQIKKILKNTINSDKNSLVKHFGIHLYDACCYALGIKNVESIGISTEKRADGASRSYIELLKSKCGIPICFFMTTNAPKDKKNLIQIIGTKKSLLYEKQKVIQNNKIIFENTIRKNINLNILWREIFQLNEFNNLNASRLKLSAIIKQGHLFPKKIKKENRTTSKVN